MQQNFTVVLKKAAGPTSASERQTTSQISAPSTGWLNNTNLGTMVGGVSALFMFAFAICAIIYQIKKSDTAKLLAKVFTTTFVTTFVLCGIFFLNAKAASSGLTLSAEDLSVEANVAGEDTFAYGEATIKVNEATNYGYTITAYTTTSDLTHTSDGAQKISALGKTAPSILSANTWGFSQEKPQDSSSSVWSSLPGVDSESVVVKDVDTATAAGDTTTLYFGVNVNDKLSLGDYKGTINYVITEKTSPDPACSAGKICYRDNGAKSPTTMSDQTVADTDTQVSLWASNYQYNGGGYGFAGWNTAADGTGANYGPNETITDANVIADIKTNGLKLYARWIKSAGALQNWSSCSALSAGSVIALTDQRDGQTYAIAKLADGNCWMVENLRFSSTFELSSATTNNPSLPLINTWWISDSDYGTAATSNYLSASSDNWCNVKDSADCADQANLNTNNSTRAVSNLDAWNDSNNVYGLGHYYNWYSATAGNGNFSMATGVVDGDICPIGWSLPYGGSSDTAQGGNTKGGFYYLNSMLGGATDSTGSSKLRAYPNNFTYAGVYFENRLTKLSTTGAYWSSTANNNNTAFSLTIDNDSVKNGTDAVGKRSGRAVRCVTGI